MMNLSKCMVWLQNAMVRASSLLKGWQKVVIKASYRKPYKTARAVRFCTPGMLISATALLKRNPNPTEKEIREALVGNLCRCTGYFRIVEAVKEAAHS